MRSALRLHEGFKALGVTVLQELPGLSRLFGTSHLGKMVAVEHFVHPAATDHLLHVGSLVATGVPLMASTFIIAGPTAAVAAHPHVTTGHDGATRCARVLRVDERGAGQGQHYRQGTYQYYP